MAIVPPENPYALLAEINGLLDKQNIAEESLDGGLFEAKSISGTRLEEKTIADSKLEKPVIAGIVEANGTISSGTGFTSEKTGAGVYKIVLSTELVSNGSFVASAIVAPRLIEMGVAAKKTFTIAFYTVAGVLTDTPFSFMIKAT